MTKDFIDIIKSRGFLHQMTDEDGLRTLLKTPGQKAYIGFDCTAKSLHVGSLLQIMLLRWWQTCGHTPIVLLGGGTTKIGDPSGKDESRPPLSDAQIQENMDSLKQVFAKFIDFDHALMVNNDDWLSKLTLMDMLQIGRHFSVNRMVKQKSVQLRLERDQEMSLLEFNYSVMQAYDFTELYKTHNCRTQLGGSDQWGNIVAGIDLHRRTAKEFELNVTKSSLGLDIFEVDTKKIYDAFTRHYPALIFKSALFDHDDPNEQITITYIDAIFGITSPLLTTSSGAKMGKTAAGAVWLNAEMLSSYNYWQFWRNTEDGDVIKFLKLFTEIELSQIAEYESWVGSAKINDAKIILATEATAMLHGREEAERAAKTAAETFSGSGVSDDLPEITINNISASVIELLVKAGFAASNGEARRLIQGNGISINDAKVTDEKQCLSEADFAQGFAKLSKGKKQHVLVKVK